MACADRLPQPLPRAAPFAIAMILMQAKTELSKTAVYRMRSKFVKCGLITVKNNGGSKAVPFHAVSLDRLFSAETTNAQENEKEGDNQADKLSVILSVILSDKLSIFLSIILSGTLSVSERNSAGGKLSALYKYKEQTQTKQKHIHIGDEAPMCAYDKFMPLLFDVFRAYCRQNSSIVNPSLSTADTPFWARADRAPSCRSYCAAQWIGGVNNSCLPDETLPRDASCPPLSVKRHSFTLIRDRMMLLSRLRCPQGAWASHFYGIQKHKPGVSQGRQNKSRPFGSKLLISPNNS